MQPTTDPVQSNLQTVESSSLNPFNNTVPTSNNSANIGQAQQLINSIDTTQSQAQQPTKQPSLLERLLPTFGGILGGLGAGAADIVSGGAAIPFDAAIAGVGGGLGKVAENALTGQKVWQGDDITQGLEQGVGQAAGMGVGKLLGAGGNALASAGASKAEQVASDQVTQDALAEQDRIGAEFGAVNPKVAQVGPAIAKANELGFANPTAQDLKNLGNIYTGSNAETGDGILNFVKNQALEKAGGNVDLSNVMDNLHTTLADPKNELLLGRDNAAPGLGQVPSGGNNVSTSIVRQVRNLMPETLDANDQITEGASPEDGQNLLKAVGKKLNGFNNLDPANPNYEAQQAEQGVWKSIYGNIRQAVYNRPEVDDAIANTKVDADLEPAIDDAISKNGITDPSQAALIKADLVKTINGSQTAQDLLSQEAPMVNVSKVGTIQTDSDTNNPQLAKSVKSAKSQINTQTPKNPASLGNVLNIGGGYEALVKGHPAAMLPALAYDVMKNPAAMQGVGNMIGKLGSTAGMAATGALGNVVAGSPNDTTSGASSGNMVDTGALSSMQDSPYTQALNTYLDRPFMPGASTAITALLPMVQKLAAASQAEQGLGQYFNAAGGAQGPIGGLLNRLGSVFTGGPAASYGAQAGQAGQTIANALGVPASDIATPQITQNKTAAQTAINNIQNLIQSLQLGNQTGVLNQQ